MGRMCYFPNLSVEIFYTDSMNLYILMYLSYFVVAQSFCCFTSWCNRSFWKKLGVLYISVPVICMKKGTNRKKTTKKNEAKLAFLGPPDWKKSNLTFCREKGFRSLISVYVEVEE